jgi:SAM-dependent methyltransferase
MLSITPMRDWRADYYSGVKGVYFFAILKRIIAVADLGRRDVVVLDFGCGTGRLSQLLPGKVIGYDAIPELSDVDDWRKTKFDVVVANEVFYLFTAAQLTEFLAELRALNPNAELVIGISRQGILNNILKHLAGRPGAHEGTQLRPNEELKILTQHLELLGHTSVFQLCDVYHMRFPRRGERT